MTKKPLFKILIIALIVIVIYKVLEVYGTKKVAFILKSEGIAYADLNIDFIGGDLELEDVIYTKDSMQFVAENISIDDFSYYNFFSNKEIHLDDLEVVNAEITGKLTQQKKDSAQIDSTKKSKISIINIENIIVDNAQLSVKKKNGFPLKINSLNIEMDEFRLDLNSSNKIPFTIDNITSSVINLETSLSEVQDFKVSRIALMNQNLVIDSLCILPTKNRKEYIHFVPKEQELMDLFTKKVEIANIKIKEQDSLFVGIESIKIDETNFDLYLDATVLEHSKQHKNLYSKSLRELPFKLDVKTIDISNSVLTYEELTKPENKPGIIIFDELEAKITNVNNSYLKDQKETVAAIKAKFMKSSPLNIKWTFDINDKEDQFRINGSLFGLTSANMSSFLLPTMNVKVDGSIHKMYFDIEGNNYVSNGKMNMDFENLKLRILDQEKHRKKVLSWVVNLLVKDKSKKGLAHAEIKEVKRDQTKSFWNYLWLNIEHGLKKSLI